MCILFVHDQIEASHFTFFSNLGVTIVIVTVIVIVILKLCSMNLQAIVYTGNFLERAVRDAIILISFFFFFRGLKKF